MSAIEKDTRFEKGRNPAPGGQPEHLVVNGLPVEAVFDRRTVDEILLPLLEKLRALREEKGRRILVFLAGPPASGKSTLALYLEKLWAEEEERKGRGKGTRQRNERQWPAFTLKALGLDGFHYPNRYLAAHTCVRDGQRIPLSSVKGAPETFDTGALADRLRALREGGQVLFPVYDRRIHDPVQDAVAVQEDIVLLEGNWLLLDEAPWRSFPPMADYTISVTAPEDLLVRRLTERKMEGGATREEAESWVQSSDARNIRRCLEEMLPADLALELLEDGALVRRDVRARERAEST